MDSDSDAHIRAHQERLEAEARVLASRKRRPYIPPKYVLRDYGTYEVLETGSESSAIAGGFGAVYKVSGLDTRQLLAMKCPKYELDSGFSDTGDILKAAKWEIYLYSHMGNANPNIVQLVLMDTDRRVPLLFMPWAKHGSLKTWMTPAGSEGLSPHGDRHIYAGTPEGVYGRLLHVAH